MPVYEMKCPQCSQEFDIRMTLSEYSESSIACQSCSKELVRHFRSAPKVSIPYHMQASPNMNKKSTPIMPINIIDEKPGGGYKVTRIGRKSDIDNE